jgi:hypothetical protein
MIPCRAFQDAEGVSVRVGDIPKFKCNIVRMKCQSTQQNSFEHERMYCRLLVRSLFNHISFIFYRGLL